MAVAFDAMPSNLVPSVATSLPSTVPVTAILPVIVVPEALTTCVATPPAEYVMVSVVNPILVSGSPMCRISAGMNKLVPSN